MTGEIFTREKRFNTSLFGLLKDDFGRNTVSLFDK